MSKDNKYYEIIENIVKQHRKFLGLEPILQDIVEDVYSHSQIIIKSIEDESVIHAYLEKVVSTSLITVPKKLNFKNLSTEIQTAASILKDNIVSSPAAETRANTYYVDKMINENFVEKTEVEIPDTSDNNTSASIDDDSFIEQELNIQSEPDTNEEETVSDNLDVDSLNFENQNNFDNQVDNVAESDITQEGFETTEIPEQFNETETNEFSDDSVQKPDETDSLQDEKEELSLTEDSTEEEAGEIDSLPLVSEPSDIAGDIELPESLENLDETVEDNPETIENVDFNTETEIETEPDSVDFEDIVDSTVETNSEVEEIDSALNNENDFETETIDFNNSSAEVSDNFGFELNETTISNQDETVETTEIEDIESVPDNIEEMNETENIEPVQDDFQEISFDSEIETNQETETNFEIELNDESESDSDESVEFGNIENLEPAAMDGGAESIEFDNDEQIQEEIEEFSEVEDISPVLNESPNISENIDEEQKNTNSFNEPEEIDLSEATDFSDDGFDLDSDITISDDFSDDLVEDDQEDNFSDISLSNDSLIESDSSDSPIIENEFDLQNSEDIMDSDDSSLSFDSDNDIKMAATEDTKSEDDNIVMTPPDYSPFDYDTASSAKPQYDLNAYAEKIEKFVEDNQDSNIIRIFNAYYKDKQSIKDIASSLSMEESDVTESLNKLISIV